MRNYTWSASDFLKFFFCYRTLIITLILSILSTSAQPTRNKCFWKFNSKWKSNSKKCCYLITLNLSSYQILIELLKKAALSTSVILKCYGSGSNLIHLPGMFVVFHLLLIKTMKCMTVVPFYSQKKILENSFLLLGKYP